MGVCVCVLLNSFASEIKCYACLAIQLHISVYIYIYIYAVYSVIFFISLQIAACRASI